MSLCRPAEPSWQSLPRSAKRLSRRTIRYIQDGAASIPGHGRLMESDEVSLS
ncbi:hypothetical protein ASPCADRAFT_211837 [Aspergillus carbonarius ITEM 5010]|uniref:Uncharacterized protein n=1 Tax=Aspergillus carbonarius (strain ITEM 5010) TaxID=602072 RepID=A0A1R3R8V2_ASPC5|nr:hypothetical protein ASPCADRAFT_211837 [Aspergillus carbonarius ITEM 5010]